MSLCSSVRPRARAIQLGQPVAGRQPVAGMVAALLLSALFAGCGQTVNQTAIQNGPALSPLSLTFPSTFVGVASAPQIVTLSNFGSSTVNVASLVASGDFSLGIAATDCAALMALPPRTSCPITVYFTPLATGTRTGHLTVTDSTTAAPQAATETVSLSGTATTGTAQLSVSPAAVAFGVLTIGSSSRAQIVTVTNSGTAPLPVTNLAISGDFSQTSNSCNGTLAINATCSIAVVFTPAAAGPRSGTLTVSAANSTGSPQTVALSGTGQLAATYAGAPLTFVVQAGIKPIGGAAVMLYAAGTTGIGSPATVLLPIPARSDSTGTALIPGGYNCPAANSLVYAVSRGGTVAGTSAANANAVLMTALGPCNSLGANGKYIVDEATTVASVEVLAQFLFAGANLGATPTNYTGLLNAFQTAATLADLGTGTSPGSTLPANAILPVPRLNALGNLLNACVVSSSACMPLYASTTPVGGAPPANTLDALLSLAHNPGSNVAALYAQSLQSTAYAPALATVPADWTIFVTYKGGGLHSPSTLGVDSGGNVWVSNYFNAASKFSPTGAPLFAAGITGSGLNNSYGLAIDQSDNVWIPNEQPFTPVGIGSVSLFNPAGASLAGNGFINGGLDYPLSIAIDPNGTVWAVDYGDSHLTLLNPAGTPLSGVSGYTSPLFAFPVAVAIDSNHFGWIANQSSNFVTRVAPDGSSFTNYDCCYLSSSVAIDQGNNVWVSNYFGDSVSLLTNSGTVISHGYTASGTINHPQGIAIDGAGTVWVANYRAPYLTVLAGTRTAVPGLALAPPGGLGSDARLLDVYSLALDSNGSVWVSNQGSDSVTRFVGLAVPVRTPLSGLPQLP